MQLCRSCLYPATHPLGITFDAEGVCSGCRVHEEKDRLNWVEREVQLQKILSSYRGRARGHHDCIVPVTGARDSFFIVHLVRKIYGLNPLLAVYNRHYNSRAGIYNISRLRTVFGCDIITLTLAPELVKRVMRATFTELGSFHWHTLAGHTVFPVQLAARMNIPLIVWGANQGVEQVGMFSHLDEVEMTRRYRREHDLMGKEAEDLIGSEGIYESDLQPFFYPEDADLRRVGVRGIYLGNYVRWDTKTQHEQMIELYDYFVGPLARTFDNYNDIDDLHFTGAHDIVKRFKHGYGKVTDDANREIRFGRLSRNEAMELVRIHDGRPAPDIFALLKCLNMTEAEFFAVLRLHARTNGSRPYADSFPCGKPPLDNKCVFRTNVPADLTGDVCGSKLLTRGYARE